MDSIQVSDTCDASSILARPTKDRLNSYSDNSRKGVQHGCSSTRYFRDPKTMDLTR